ncbi:hypothetical protein BDN70DRAFT_870986 [Pholiota conissans]|uniref:Complex 1 LYR protein domain-containing protein n=1 Tax=Pholiota conissans TaxID=109636 RepID=A0A9P6CZW5_9AGAR|nr:hypothetical protein BDN70DRAFT_870986 [Pholiota conissans]
MPVTVAAAPMRQAVLSLYHSMLRTSNSFSSYNFREYFVQRTKDSFRAMQAEQDQQRLSHLYAEALREHNVLQRSAVVNRMYAGPKLAVETTRVRDGKASGIPERSDS